MSIYRGPGGAGDATNDATSQAILASASAVAAANSEAAAASSASQSATSATNAANSATAAATSASQADTSATSAANSASTATTKASEASTSATNAASSATSAAASATTATNKATEASNSADAAATSASAAATSASNAAASASTASTSSASAASSATNAASSATSAASSASSATSSATAAASSATSAGNSASTATTQATNAATSATAAATSASNASTSATSASGSASTATTQATNASNSASAAATSATNASNSASAASTSATNAATSATNAANSAIAAANSAASINPADLVHISGTETITGAKTFSAAPTVSSGTANGVAYLNGSKVLTTDSVLTFNGASLGIGTSSPYGRLTLSNGSDNNLEFWMTSPIGASASNIQSYNRAGSAWKDLFYGAAAHYFNTGGTERMRIDSSGNVGIGTNSPSYKIESYVNNGSASGAYYPIIVNGTTSSTASSGSAFGFVHATRATGSIEALRTNPGAHYGSDLVFKTNADSTATGTLASLTEAMRLDSSQNLKFNSGYGSVATAYGCRAWVKFNGTGTIAINASGNVSSLTDGGVGIYSINLTNAMPDTNYAVVSSSRYSGTGPSVSSTTQTSTSVAFVNTLDFAGTNIDVNNISVALFR